MPPLPSNPVSRWCPAALALLTVVVWGRVCAHEFVNLDDDKFIAANSAFLPPTGESLASLWQQPHAHLYVPVTMTCWWLIAQVAGVRDNGAAALNPWLFHAASLLVHVANVVLVWRIARVVTRDDRAAALGAAVFAVHPLQAEAVAWASELKDLLACALGLSALLAALAASQRQSPARQRWPWWTLSILCYLAALLSKPSIVVLPVIAASLLWLTHATRRTYVCVLIVGSVLALPIMMIARAVQPALDIAPVPALSRLVIAGDALWFYLCKLVAPVNLAIDYGRTPWAVLQWHALRWAWIPLALTCVVLLTRRRMLIAGWIIFVVALAPTLGLVPFDFQSVSTVADHYAYTALLGIALICAAAMCSLRSRAWSVAMTIVIALLAALSIRQAGHWRDSEALWAHTIAVNPRSELAWVNLGTFRLGHGDAGGAIDALLRARQLNSGDPFVHMNLMRARLLSNDTAGAALSALDLAHAYQQRADYDPKLTAAVLEKFASAIEAKGDGASAKRLREAARPPSR